MFEFRCVRKFDLSLDIDINFEFSFINKKIK